MWCLFITDRFQAGGVPVSHLVPFSPMCEGRNIRPKATKAKQDDA